AYEVAVSGNYAYVADYNSGLQVIDVSNPRDCHRVGGYATSRTAWAVAISGDLAYVTTSLGLEVFDISTPAEPRRVGGNSSRGARQAVVTNERIFISGGWLDGLWIAEPFRAHESRPRLGVSPNQTKGAFAIWLEGPIGTNFRVERSLDLQTWQTWQPIRLGA